ncbi:MAG: adenosylmethionine--8-amino-7-oxononanoate transaminase [Selenomonadaceae bacterium]|nr:adenosylmethionine--8-amino-7-oxononanoate transaminase [Selenomonadaceae bacterium]
MVVLKLEEVDLNLIWHPCSQMKDYETLPPIVVDHGKGVWLFDIYGNKYLDIVSSWWCNLLGHCNPDINNAIKNQIDNLEHVIFANFTHKPAIEVAQQLSKIVPSKLKKFHFNDNGSAAIECALKMCFQYFLQTGKPKKQHFMCLTNGYHGETIGALSVGALDLYTELYRPLMLHTFPIEAPDCYRCKFGQCRGKCQCECIADAESVFEQHADETAAIILEPLLQGSAGMRVYPPLYLKKLRKLCDDYDVLMIADEIATGFGRTGKMFACDHAEISPDVMCLSKGLTGGYMPMSVTCVSQEIYDAFYDDYNTGKAFMHSHTYAGNPMACAASLAVQKILREQNILQTANDNAKWLTNALNEALGDNPNVGEIRHIGLIHAIELVKDKNNKTPFDSKRRLGYSVYKRALKYGLLLRPLGDVLYFNPPLIISREDLTFAIDVTKRSINEMINQ